jgi:hypothetical protein
MRISVHAAPESASKAVAELREEKPVLEIIATSRNDAKWFPGLAKRLSRDKPAAAVHHLTDAPERTCYDWCKGKVDPPARTLLKLLDSPVGWTVLEYILRGSKQPWWLDLQRARVCAAAYEQARGQLELAL